MKSGNDASAPGKPSEVEGDRRQPQRREVRQHDGADQQDRRQDRAQQDHQDHEDHQQHERDHDLVVADARLLGVVVDRRRAADQRVLTGDVVEDAAHLDHGLLGRVGVGGVGQRDVELHEAVDDHGLGPEVASPSGSPVPARSAAPAGAPV